MKIDSAQKLNKLTGQNPKLKWIIMSEYTKQVRNRIELIEKFILNRSTLNPTEVEMLFKQLNMSIAHERDRMLVAFVPPDSIFDMSKSAISALHRLIKPKAGNMMMIIDGVELIIYC
jgi:hypothetical protein